MNTFALSHFAEQNLDFLRLWFLGTSGFEDFPLSGFQHLVMVFRLCFSRLELTLDPELALGKVGIWKRSCEKKITRCGDVQPAFLSSGLPGFWLRWYAGCLTAHIMEGAVLAFIYCCITATESFLHWINSTGLSLASSHDDHTWAVKASRQLWMLPSSSCCLVAQGTTTEHSSSC